MPNYHIGQFPRLKGCFTEEFCIRGMTLRQIGVELGLPMRRIEKGAYIAFALQLPAYHEFRLGGWAEFSTDKFVTYNKRKGKIKWHEDKFEEVYEGRRVPISIDEAKKAWLKNMRYHKLIKILPALDHQESDDYPTGGKASQIIITHPVRCQVVQFLKLDDVFHSVWG